MATLTTSWKSYASASQTISGVTVTFYLEARYSSQSTPNNTSTVYTRLRSAISGGSLSGAGYSYTCTYCTSKSGTAAWSFANETILSSSAQTISHDSSGKKTLSLKATAKNTYWGINKSLSVSVDLPTINRKATISSVTNFNDEGNPMVIFSNPGGFHLSPYLDFYDKSGNKVYGISRSKGSYSSPYNWSLSNSEREALRQATNKQQSYTVTVGLTTYYTSTSTESHSVPKTMTYINAEPSEVTEFEETNEKVIGLLGSSSANTIIQNISSIKMTSTSTILKNATLSKIQFEHNNISVAKTSSPYEYTFIPVNSAFKTTVIDSRGYAISNTYTKDIIEYLPVDITSYSFKRVNPTSSDILLNATIRYKQATFNENVNIPTIKWKMGEDGQLNTISSSDYTIDTSNNTITISNLTLQDALNYQNEARFYLYANDLLTEDAENVFVTKGIPTCEAGEHDFQVNGELYIANADRTNKKEIRDLIYPVGSIYMSVNNTNPSTLFGGTWVQLQNRFLLGAGSSYTAGVTGGSATHTLTIDEMPSHSHGLKNDKTGGSGSAKWVINSSASSGTGVITNTGGNQAHNNMPPYLVVYMWKRTA